MTEGSKPVHARRKKGSVYRIIGGKRIVQGITHGRNGYTNYKCRCKTCTGAQAAYMNEWRSRLDA